MYIEVLYSGQIRRKIGSTYKYRYVPHKDVSINDGPHIRRWSHNIIILYYNTGLFISPSGIYELDCATTKTDTAERSISIGRESRQVFFLY